MNRLAICLTGLVLSASVSLAAEKTLMHCFAFTPVETATADDWKAFAKASDELPKKVPGLRRVWHGKLLKPMQKRMNGVCMEFQDQKAFEAYDPHPAHKEWVDVYSKVRVPGTTTFQIVPEK
jgi:Stress responsive A/B Barrel Domain